jgi:transketolase
MIRTDDTTTDRCVNALRFLACDAIEKAHSGHPGLPLGAAPAAFALWTRHLRHDPTDPSWADRDRFVLSAGHGSALLYALLHLTGHDVPLAELESFRQWESHTPGHPESHVTRGVEVTTGPLGQGLANAVGLAIAEANLAATFNRPGHAIVDHSTYVIVGDGDLMEGVAYEACALAGHLRLGKLIVLFDANRISLAGTTSLATSEDIVARFDAAGWQTVTVGDGNDVDAIDRAIQSAKTETNKPSLIVIETIIGFGAPTKQNTFKAHGAPLGPDELSAAKRALGWPVDPPFHVPDDVRSFFDPLRRQAARTHDDWRRRFDAFQKEHPVAASEFERRVAGELPSDWATAMPTFEVDAKGLATRKASEAILQAVASRVPELIGGSADLNPSTFTWLKGYGDFQAPEERPDDVQGAIGDTWDYSGRNVHFGVREHAMGAIVNGMAQHGALIPYTATFLVFADYMRPARRPQPVSVDLRVHARLDRGRGGRADAPAGRTDDEPPPDPESGRIAPGRRQ